MKASGRTLDTDEIVKAVNDYGDWLPVYVRFPDGTRVTVSSATIESSDLIIHVDAESDTSVLDRALSLLETIADGKGKYAADARRFVDEVS